MKMTKKLGSVLLAVLLLLSLSVTAFASSKVTIDSKLEGHTFTAYQIFTGTQAADQDNELASVQWGTDIDTGKFVAALKKIDVTRFADCNAEDPQSVVKALSGADEELAKQIAEAAYDSHIGTGTTFSDSTVLPNGYYLIKDTTPVDDLNGNEAYNDVVLQVTENVSIQYKTSVPTSEKKVKDDDAGADWQDSADWNIGADVPFQIKGTLPTNYGDYDEYALTFHDKESGGLKFNAESVVVYVDGTKIDSGSGYEVKAPGDDGCTFDIVFANVKGITSAHAGSVITVEYTSKLEEGAVIGQGHGVHQGNPNTMHMTFSNNPHGEGTGKTPDDTVTVFTYQLEVEKVDGENQPLEGAGFTLYKKSAAGEYVAVGTEKLVEAVTVTNDDGEEPTKYVVNFKGLDDGDYKLVETKVPAGYNKADDIEFTVSASHTDGDEPALGSLSAKGLDGETDVFTGSMDTGVFSGTVVNQSGLELPETGGMGTTIFYVAGGILVVVALVLLVTKRRVKSEQ